MKTEKLKYDTKNIKRPQNKFGDRIKKHMSKRPAENKQ